MVSSGRNVSISGRRIIVENALMGLLSLGLAGFLVSHSPSAVMKSMRLLDLTLAPSGS